MKTGVEVVGAVNSERPFPITEADMLVEDEDGELTYGGTEHTLNHRHLYLRTTRATTMLKLRSSAFGAIHNYFRGHDFLEYQAPNFVAGAVEGGQRCLKFRILESKPTSRSRGNSTLKRRCPLWSACTPSPPRFGLKNRGHDAT